MGEGGRGESERSEMKNNGWWAEKTKVMERPSIGEERAVWAVRETETLAWGQSIPGSLSRPQ